MENSHCIEPVGINPSDPYMRRERLPIGLERPDAEGVESSFSPLGLDSGVWNNLVRVISMVELSMVRKASI